MKLFEHTSIPSLSKAMGAYSLRHKAISANIANAGTSGYVPKHVAFEEELSAADSGGGSLSAATTNARHLPFGQQSIADVQPVVSDDASRSGTLASGVNDVDIDQEMAELAKNQIRYKFSSRLLGEAFKALQSSIRGTA